MSGGARLIRGVTAVDVAARGPLLLLCWFSCPALAAWVEIGLILTFHSRPVIGAATPVVMLGLLTAVLWARPGSPLWSRLVATGSTLSAAATGWIFLAGTQSLATF